jgi:hypothetical protein
MTRDSLVLSERQLAAACERFTLNRSLPLAKQLDMLALVVLSAQMPNEAEVVSPAAGAAMEEMLMHWFTDGTWFDVSAVLCALAPPTDRETWCNLVAQVEERVGMRPKHRRWPPRSSRLQGQIF